MTDTRKEPDTSRTLEVAASRAHRLKGQGADRTLMFVRIETSWDSAEELREFVTKRCKRYFIGSVAERASLVTHELLEVASRFGSVAADTTFELDATEGGFEIRVTFDTFASRLPSLQKKARKAAELNPEDALQSGVKDVAHGFGDELMLGLTRLRGEEVDLQLEVDGLTLTWRARSRSMRRLRR